MVLTWRYSAATRAFLERVRAIEPFGGYALNISGALYTIESPWRQERGAILDVGPHMIDMLDAALGRVAGIRAHGHPLGWVGLLLEHETGAVSEASLSMAARVEHASSHIAVYGRHGSEGLDGDSRLRRVPRHGRRVRRDRRGGGHPLDARTASVCSG